MLHSLSNLKCNNFYIYSQAAEEFLTKSFHCIKFNKTLHLHWELQLNFDWQCYPKCGNFCLKWETHRFQNSMWPKRGQNISIKSLDTIPLSTPRNINLLPFGIPLSVSLFTKCTVPCCFFTLPTHLCDRLLSISPTDNGWAGNGRDQ